MANDKIAAFDMDGIIWSEWNAVIDLIKDLKTMGWKIYVLSPNPLDDLNNKIDKKGIRSYIDGIINNGDKGKACKDYGVSLFIDDNSGYIEQARRESPNTLTLHRVP